MLISLRCKSLKVLYTNCEKYNLKKLFIIRGFIHLYESMKIGYKTLDWSAETYDEENNSKSKNSLLNSILEKIVRNSLK